MAGAEQPPAVALQGISKRFGTVLANQDIDLAVASGTIHGIVGENGAGKSTLMSILYGFYQADAGEILIDGTVVRIQGSADAIRHGIGMVHQHFMLVETFTVLENLALGAEDGPLLRRGLDRARRTLKQIGDTYGLSVDPDAIVGGLAVGQQQRVEILKALYREARILILDEPTGVLTPQEADHLFKVLAALRQQGKTVILITHKLREIMAITDNVSVMRQGRMVAHRKTAETSAAELSELMVGRKVVLHFDKAPARPGATALSVTGLHVTDGAGIERVKGVDLTVRAGEIVGIAGVAGNGQSELLEAIAGIRRPRAGRIRSGDIDLFPHPDFSSRRVRDHRIAHVPEDRHRTGMVGAFPARENVLLGEQDSPAFHRHGLIDWKRVSADATAKMTHFDVRPCDPTLKMANFSGGNQQKLILAREMERDPILLLVGQPTRGVDIGAIEFIHRRLLALRDAGKAILLVSVELEEIMSLSDRILVMFDGRIVGEVTVTDPGAVDERMLGLLMAGCQPGQPGVIAR
ncbi:MAG: ABC transporter ATP-binding protein [Azospirillaceae bacterium]|nr:ABC transporter ATP-binding protein [Azospirillaceae bacterium]